MLGIKPSYFDGREFAEHHFSWLITLEPYGLLGSSFAYLFFYYCPATGMQNGDEALPSIFLTSQGFFSENGYNS